MRVKHLKVNDVFDIRNLDVEFAETDNVICVVDEHKNPFEEYSFIRMMNRLFLDVFYPADYLCGNGKIQCLCERFGEEYLICLQGKKEKTETFYGDKKMQGLRCGVEEVCFCDEKTSGRFKWLLEKDYREILYPSELREYAHFDANGANNGLTEVVDAIDTESALFGWLSEADWKQLKIKIREYLTEFDGIPFIDGQPLKVNRRGELVFQERYSIFEAEECFSNDEYLRIQFLYWLTTQRFIQRLCKDVRHDGDLPVFVTGLFERIDAEKETPFLLEEMRKAGRQIFILLPKNNPTFEKYCDKVVKINRLF